ncbi:MAG: Flp pilus assembly complex ATPase component TadA [Elusimicrobia bacterium]|nr:Flp pilus assembly complex ATPase component TadA [Elusimicrobiota bacterium]
MAIHNTELIKILTKENLVDAKTLEGLSIRAKQLGKSLEQLLIDTEILPKDMFLKLLSEKWDVKSIDLDTAEIDPEAARLIPETVARRYQILPFAKSDTELFTAMTRPWDLTAIEDLTLRTNYRIRPFFALPANIEIGLKSIFTQDSKIADYITNIASSGVGAESALKEQDDIREEITMDRSGADDEKQARKVTNAIILEGLSRGASDIHIEPFETSFLIRYRIDGHLHKSSFSVPKLLANAIIARIKILSKTMDITEKRLPQDGRIQVTFQNRPIEFRVNTVPTAYGESCVMRILDRSSIKVDLPKLGFLPDTLETLKSILTKPYGIILVSGPTGSGKSTTLYSCLNFLIQDSKKNPEGKDKEVTPKKILTAENPVEYDLAEVVQLNINPDIGLNFAEAMRAFLRQDPDIIMVGEIRDRETAQIAMEAAMTGHLVLSTIHTNDSATSVSRLAEMQVPTYLIASTIEGVLAQRLVRTICPNCSEPLRKTPQRLKEEFDKLNIPEEERNPRIGRGCKECGDSGYKGRSGIYELLIMDQEIRDSLLENVSAGPLKKTLEAKGMRTIWQDGILKVANGKTTYEEILRVSQ